MKNIVSVKNVMKSYGTNKQTVKAISDISFDIQKGEFVGIMGPSGSGKTTLLNCISTIDKYNSGSISINGIDLGSLKKGDLAEFRRDELGFIFQDFNLLDTLTVYENIALALTIKEIKQEEIDREVRKVAETLGITATLDKYPYQLSGGEQQRTACARALISKPSLILADEPTGALDSNTGRNLLESFTQMNEKLGGTILMVTHDTVSASYCRRILFMKDGRLYQELQRENQSQNEFFKEIMEIITVLGGEQKDVS